MKPMLVCCYIGRLGQIWLRLTKPTSKAHWAADRVGCRRAADYELLHGPGPDDYTHACTRHVGKMLVDGPVQVSPVWNNPLEIHDEVKI